VRAVERMEGRGPVNPFREARVAAQFFGRSTGELKGVDTVLTLNPVIATTSTNASSFTLNLIVPGSGSFNRVGRTIMMKSVRLYGQLVYTYGLTATTNDIIGNTLRMVVVYDKQPSGVSPGVLRYIWYNTPGRYGGHDVP